jgi:hypothetical protein
VSHFTNNYGGMYGAALTVTITAINTWATIPTGLTAGNMNGFTFSGNGLICQGAGTFFLALSVSLACTASNQNVTMSYSINGTPAATFIKGTLLNANGAMCLTLSDVVTLQLGDQVQVIVQNNTAKTNLTEVSTSLSIARLQR